MVGVLHVKLHLIQKKISEEGGVNIPILQMSKVRHRGSNAVTRSEMDDIFESVFIYTQLTLWERALSV